MAEGLNKAILIGNLGADPELRFTQGGQAVLKLRLATTESYVDRNKERQQRTEWHSVVVWGNRVSQPRITTSTSCRARQRRFTSPSVRSFRAG